MAIVRNTHESGAPTSRPAAPDRPQQIHSSSAVRPRDNGMAVEPVRKERDRPVRTDVLLLGHTGLALQDARGFGEQPDADHEQHGADGDREAELAHVLRPVWISA